MKMSQQAGSNPKTPRSLVQRSNHYATDRSCRINGNLWYLCTEVINVYVASHDPDPNPRGGGQLPNPKSAILR